MKIHLPFFLVLLSTITYAQKIVDKISFSGLQKTDEQFLRQFILTSPGDAYDAVKLTNDRQRLLNLAILNEVEIVTTENNDSVSVEFRCHEMINTLPIFALGQTENTFWLRAGLQSLNFTGRADKIVAYYQYYDRHSIYLNYITNRLKNSNWGFSASLIKWATIEPLRINDEIVNFDYTNYTGYVSAIRFLSFRESVDFGVGIFDERYEKRESDVINKEEIVQGKKLLTKLIFKSNHLDYSTFYVKGILNQLNVEFIRAFDEGASFVIVFNDFRYFTTLTPTLNLATRLRTGLATNDNNPFAPFILDSYINIRGVGNRVDRGTGSIVFNAELRQTLFDRKILAAQGVAFVDAGAWRQPGGDFSDFTKTDNMRLFSGLGFRLIYKKAFDTMLRVDVGYDYNEKTGIVIGVGQYF